MIYKIIYNLLFPLVVLFGGPYFIYRISRRGNWRDGFGERFGFYPEKKRQLLKSFDRPVWIHAVSVGEVIQARVIIRELRELNPDQKVVVTSNTATGIHIARKHLDDEQTVVLYTALDVLPIVRSVFNRINPSLFILIEQEIWPNHLWIAEQRKTPIWILNGRLSDRSWKRFKKLRRWLKPLLSKVTLVGLQARADEVRFAQAGFPAEGLTYHGSLKYDVSDLVDTDPELPELLMKQVGWSGNLILMAGSTFAGEEALMVEHYMELKEAHPELRLFIAPRHAERAASLVKELKKYDVRVVRRSQVENLREGDLDPDVLLLDTTGELKSLYTIADVVFIGKTLRSPAGKGGQNFLEPARAGKPIVVGRQVENFRALVREFLDAEAIIQVKTDDELKNAFAQLLDDGGLRARMGNNSLGLFNENLGAGRRCAEWIGGYLKS